MQLLIPFKKLNMVTITSYIFINIVQTVHFSTVKFDWGNEKNYELSSNTRKFVKNLKQLDRAPLNKVLYDII